MSILSENIAKRCNLMRLVDKRWNAKVQGVGGSQRLLGKIHACRFIWSFLILEYHTHLNL